MTINTIAIDKELVPQVSEFLHRNMNGRFSVTQWQTILTTQWLDSVPNYGFALVNEHHQVVGAICALYSQQWLNGELRQMCNPHTWCVLPEFRKHSISVVLAVIKQAGYHFTMFTPNKSGLEIFSYLRFIPLKTGLRWLPNLPLPVFSNRTHQVDGDKEIHDILSPHDWQIFTDHRSLDGVYSMVLRTEEGPLLILMKRQKFKRTWSAQLMYVSDYALFARCWRSIRFQLLSRFGFKFTRVEMRFMPDNFSYWGIAAEGHQRFYLSQDLRPEDIQYVYSEMVAMRL
ncbi:hypothetical protein [Bowmanella sp. JS7-9]|uniref:N-acetyltransferase domain-containing protein n=1 Tax=Pseudobowmanella zhangzhouensis TaxID=1537679 RepID=A0ABW1XH74_9ALTE|nr:hypothetical protein [Bowmanella sp. JS7-9]TBX20846.1 hypothetical protein TK45_13795 [Bowmanella sp. JS7-9]